MVPCRYNFLFSPQGRPCGRPPAAAVLGRQHRRQGNGKALLLHVHRAGIHQLDDPAGEVGRGRMDTDSHDEVALAHFDAHARQLRFEFGSTEQGSGDLFVVLLYLLFAAGTSADVEPVRMHDTALQSRPVPLHVVGEERDQVYRRVVVPVAAAELLQGLIDCVLDDGFHIASELILLRTNIRLIHTLIMAAVARPTGGCQRGKWNWSRPPGRPASGSGRWLLTASMATTPASLTPCWPPTCRSCWRSSPARAPG